METINSSSVAIVVESTRTKIVISDSSPISRTKTTRHHSSSSDSTKDNQIIIIIMTVAVVIVVPTNSLKALQATIQIIIEILEIVGLFKGVSVVLD